MKDVKTPSFGWSASGSKFLLKTQSGRRVQVSRKKINATRGRPGHLPYSNAHLAAVLAKNKKPKAANGPKAPKAKPSGWTSSGSKYRTKSASGRRAQVSKNKMNATRAAPGHLPYSNAHIAKLAQKLPKAPTKKQLGWTASGSKYLAATNSGRRVKVPAKKMNAARGLPGHLPYSNVHIAQLARSAKPSPKTPSEGWTPSGSRYLTKTEGSGRRVQVSKKKMNAARSAPGHLPYSNAQIAKRALAAAKADGPSRENLNALRGEPGHLLFSNKHLSKLLKKGRNGYSEKRDMYSFVDDTKTKRTVKGENVRAAISGGNSREPMNIARSIAKRRLDMRGVDEKRDWYVTTFDKTTARKTFPLSTLRAIQTRYGSATLDEAAKTYAELEAARPAKKSSGFAVNTANLQRKYYLWTGARHEKVPLDEVQHFKTAPDTTNHAAAAAALKHRKAGWNPEQTAYFVLAPSAANNSERRLVRIDRDVMSRIKDRLRALGKPAHNTDAALAWLRSAEYAKTLPPARPGHVGWFDYRRDVYVSPGAGGVQVPGAAFVKEYAHKPNVNEVPNEGNAGGTSGIWTEKATTIVAKHSRNVMVQAIEADLTKREAVDAAWIRKMPAPDSPGFPAHLRKLFEAGGPLIERPMLPGNVGTPGDPRSPYAQLQDSIDKTTDGCKTKVWPDGRGQSLQIHQGVSFAMANLRARDAIRTPGLLSLVSTGGGKTVIGLSIIVAFWNKTVPRTDKPFAIFPLSVRSNQTGNDIPSLAKSAIQYFAWFRSTVPGIDAYPFANGPAAAARAITKRLQDGHRALGYEGPIAPEHLMATYATLAHDFYGHAGKGPRFGRLPAKHCVFIADEIQMLFAPASSEKSYPVEYAEIEKLLTTQRDPATTWVCAMTATPGETVDQVARVMHCIAGRRGGFSVPGPALSKAARGLVSYAYTLGDGTKFARVRVRHECMDLADLNTPEHGNFTDLYMSSLAKLPETRNVPELVVDWTPNDGGGAKRGAVAAAHPNVLEYSSAKKTRFWSRVRQRSEWLRVSPEVANNFTPNKPNKPAGNSAAAAAENTTNENNIVNVSGADKDALRIESDKRYSPIVRAKNATGELFYLMSPKLVQIILNIINPANDGVHYVYSADWTSLRLIAWALETRFGYSRFHQKASTPAKRYAIINASAPPTTTFYVPRYYTALPNKTATRRERMLPQPSASAADVSALLNKRNGVLHNPANLDGSLVKVVLATRDSYKGVDIPGLRHIHVTGALVDYTDLIQLVGRGTRMCGHSKMSHFTKRSVTVHMYRLVSGKECTRGENSKIVPDCYVFKHAKDRYENGWKRIEKALMDASVDAALFKTTYNRASEQLHDDLGKGCGEVTVNPRLTAAAKLLKPKKPRAPPKKKSISAAHNPARVAAVNKGRGSGAVDGSPHRAHQPPV